VDEVGSLQSILPEAIRVDLKHENGALLAAVAGQVALTVSVEIEAADATAAIHRTFPDAGVHTPTCCGGAMCWRSGVAALSQAVCGSVQVLRGPAADAAGHLGTTARVCARRDRAPQGDGRLKQIGASTFPA